MRKGGVILLWYLSILSLNQNVAFINPTQLKRNSLSVLQLSKSNTSLIFDEVKDEDLGVFKLSKKPNLTPLEPAMTKKEAYTSSDRSDNIKIILFSTGDNLHVM